MFPISLDPHTVKGLRAVAKIDDFVMRYLFSIAGFLYGRAILFSIVLTLGFPLTLARGQGAQILGPQDTKVSSLCDMSHKVLKEASAVRGLSVVSTVPCIVEDKEAVRTFLNDTIRTELPPHKLAMEEVAYKAIGLIPDSFDYQTGLVEFLVTQIGGYYNPKKKLFVMAGWLPAALQKGVAVHELTHALQDQHYNLKPLMDTHNATTDAGLAVSALVEGDASAVMFDYERKEQGQPSLSTVSSIDGMLLLQVLGLGMGEGVPESLKTLLIFPYTSGLRFVHALLTRGGYGAVDRAYARLPTTTREILHPEEYLTGTFVAQIPSVEELEGVSAGRTVEYADVLGEFGISSLFRGLAATKEKGVAAAVGWVGDRLAVFPERNGERIISWLTRWESESDANEFATLYQQYRRGLAEQPMLGEQNARRIQRSVSVAIRQKSVSVVIKERVR